MVAGKAGSIILLKRRSSDRPAPSPIDPLEAEAPSSGIRISVFRERGEVTALYPLIGDEPDFELLTPRLSLPRTSGVLTSWDQRELGTSDNLRAVLLGNWNAEGHEPVQFRVRCDDGCRLWVDGDLVVDHGGVHSFDEVRESDFVPLASGRHRIAVDYFEWRGEAGLLVEWRARASGEFRELDWGVTLP